MFVTKYQDVDATVRAMKAGAIEFLTQPVVPESLLAAVAEAFAKDRSARVRLARATSLHQLMRQLTPREREVFTLVVSGLPPLFDRVTTAEIGRRAGFSDASHFAKVMRVRTGRSPLQIRRSRHN